jgi:hypothetical protein
MNRGRGRRQRGQAIIEFALMAPLLVLLAIGVYDFGRAFSYTVSVIAGARAGARVAALDSQGNIGESIRGEPSSQFNPTQGGVWGDEAQAGTNFCDSVPVNGSTPHAITNCGSPTGCAASDFDAHPNQYACFAVRMVQCESVAACDHPIPLNGGDGWGHNTYTLADPNASLYSSGSPLIEVQVLVTYRFHPLTPLLGGIIGNHGGDLLITRSAFNVPEY